MNDRIERLLETLIHEVRKGNELNDPVSANTLARESIKSAATKKDKDEEKKEKEIWDTRKNNLKTANAILNQNLGFANSGDYRQAINSGGMLLGGTIGAMRGNAMKGAGIGSSIASTVTEIAQLFAPRGYNAFNGYEKFDRTVTEPYKQVENYVAKMAYYGVNVSPEDQKAILEQQKKAAARSQAAIERTRGALGGETAVSGYYWEQLKGAAVGAWSWATGDSHEDTMREAMKQRKKINSVMRANRLDDDY